MKNTSTKRLATIAELLRLNPRLEQANLERLSTLRLLDFLQQLKGERRTLRPY